MHICKVSEKSIHWCWRFSSGRTNLGRTDGLKMFQWGIIVLTMNIIIIYYIYTIYIYCVKLNILSQRGVQQQRLQKGPLVVSFSDNRYARVIHIDLSSGNKRPFDALNAFLLVYRGQNQPGSHLSKVLVNKCPQFFSKKQVTSM